MGYEVTNLADTLTKAKAAGVDVLVPPYKTDEREAVVVQFPGGYIAEIHSTRAEIEPGRHANCCDPGGHVSVLSPARARSIDSDCRHPPRHRGRITCFAKTMTGGFSRTRASGRSSGTQSNTFLSERDETTGSCPWVANFAGRGNGSKTITGGNSLSPTASSTNDTCFMSTLTTASTFDRSSN